MTRRPRRPLSSEEQRLWTEIARSVRPLRLRPNREELAQAPAPAPRPVLPAKMAPSRPEPRPPVPVRPPPPPSPPPLAPMDRRAARRLAAGQVRPARSLDLHGLTQAEAHGRLVGFLRAAQAGDDRLVLVITGQGARGAGAGERGVLRRMVPLWLRLPELRGLVIGFEEAGPRQGGSGALYVRLRRATRP